MFKTILLPLAERELAEAILPHALEVGRRFESRVVLLHVLPTLSALLMQPIGLAPTATGSAMNVEFAQQSLEAERQAAVALIADVERALAAEGLACESELREGDPSTVILEVASEKDVDLIAMATHGRGGLGRALLGSVADEVLRKPPHLPVLLIRMEV